MNKSIIPGFSLILKKKKKVLLAHRSVTTSNKEIYTFIGSTLDHQLSLKESISKEVQKLLGISIDPNDLKFVHIIFNKKHKDSTFIHFFFSIDKWDGEPSNKNPEKFKNVDWFSVDNLPEQMASHAVEILTKSPKEFFSELT